MQADFLSWLLLTLAVAAAVAVSGSGVYCALRAVEKWDVNGALTFNSLIRVFALFGVWTAGFRLAPFISILAVLAGLCGFTFHRKTGGASESVWEAMLLIMAASLVTLGISVCALPLVPVQLKNLLPSAVFAYSTHFHLFLLFASAPLTPFLLWIHRYLRLRPGIDRHFVAGEDI